MTLFWVLLVAIAEHMCLPFRMYPLWRQWQPSTKHRAEQSRASSTCWCGGEAENLLVGFGLGWPLQGATFTSKKHLGLVLIISHVQLQVQSIVYLFWMQPLVHCDKSWHHHFSPPGLWPKRKDPKTWKYTIPGCRRNWSPKYRCSYQKRFVALNYETWIR
jgi:hypothetical protein